MAWIFTMCKCSSSRAGAQRPDWTKLVALPDSL